MISVVVPCYNEEENVEDVYRNLTSSLKSLGKNYEIIFVDDGSEDSTKKIIERLEKSDSHVVPAIHEKNMGLGKALETGFRRASGDVIITTDADSTHDASLIPNMAELVNKGYDVVIGSRYVGGGKMLNVPLYRIIVSMFTSMVLHPILGIRDVKDMTSGYRAYSPKVKNITITSAGFQSELEILYKISRLGAKIVEIPIVLEMRKKGNSKFKLFKTAKEYLWLVVRLRLNLEK